VDLQLLDVHRQVLACHDIVLSDPPPRTKQFGIDNPAVVAMHRDRDFGPGSWIGLRERVVVFPWLEILGRDASAKGDLLDGDEERSLKCDG
jgi:hypothetical protein